MNKYEYDHQLEMNIDNFETSIVFPGIIHWPIFI
jgi:hypothetical protein